MDAITFLMGTIFGLAIGAVVTLSYKIQRAPKTNDLIIGKRPQIKRGRKFKPRAYSDSKAIKIEENSRERI